MIKKIIFAFAIFTVIFYPLNYIFSGALEIIYRIIPAAFNILVVVKKYGRPLIMLFSALITYRFAQMVHTGK